MHRGKAELAVCRIPMGSWYLLIFAANDDQAHAKPSWQSPQEGDCSACHAGLCKRSLLSAPRYNLGPSPLVKGGTQSDTRKR